MSLMGLNRFVRKYGWIVMAVVAFVFVIGGVVSGLGGAVGGGPGPGMARQNPTQEEDVATVGGEKISRSTVDAAAEQYEAQQAQLAQLTGQPQDPADKDRYRVQALENDIRQQGALVAAAKTAGITVNDSDLNATREQVWQSRRASFAQELGLKPDATDSEFSSALAKVNPQLSLDALKAQVLSAVPNDRLQVQAYVNKLLAKFKGETHPTDDAVKRSLSDVSVRHILIKFGTGGLPEPQARSKAEKILAEVKANPAKMGDLAKQFSDDAGSKAKGGVYDWTPADVQGIVPEFSAALDKLQPGQTYPELVRHADPQPGPGYEGFHIIRLESVKQGKDYPKDFDKEKQKYTTEFVEKYAQRRVQQAVTAALPDVKVDITDPGIKAAQLQQEAATGSPKDRDAKLTEALALLDKVDKKNDPYGTVPIRKARILEQLGKKQDAIAAYKDALTLRNVPETRFALAALYAGEKDKANAITQLDEAQKLAVPSPIMEIQISTLYKQLGETEKAAAAGKKADAMFKQQQEQQKQAMAQSQMTLPAPPAASPAPKGSPTPAASASPAAKP